MALMTKEMLGNIGMVALVVAFWAAVIANIACYILDDYPRLDTEWRGG